MYSASPLCNSSANETDLKQFLEHESNVKPDLEVTDVIASENKDISRHV
jgi:hypothetical protein